MKRRAILLILFTVILFPVCYVNAQDIHFSQFFSAPLNTNPANTGNFIGDYRGVLNNKNQWKTFTNAYRTFAGSIDASYNNVFIEQSRAGVGLVINNDIAGDGHLGTNQFYLLGAYSIRAMQKHELRFGFGFNVGYVLHGINFNNFYFGDQFSGEQFDPYLPTGETWSYDRINYFDLGFGTNIEYSKDTLFDVFAGFSVSHVTTPWKSFSENPDTYLPIKWIVSAGGEYHVQDDLFIEPVFMAMFQQKYTEYNFGALARFDYNPANLQSIYFGGTVRTSDAGIICFGFKYHDVKLMINYDINLSNLSTISRGKGGVEFSLIYIFLKPRPFETPYYRKCPDFI